MNAARQISRRFGRTTGTRTRFAVDYCINATASTKSDPLGSLIYRPTDKKQINANNAEAKSVKDEEIVALIINNPTLSMQEYANKLQIKYSVLRGRIAKLKAKGLRHEGSKKSGRWIFSQPC